MVGNQNKPSQTAREAESGPPGREPDTIYQRGKIAGRVIDSEVDLEAKEIRFGEIYESDWLVLPDECEYLQYRIQIQHVRDAKKVAEDSRHRGRILRGCVADIVGYRDG